MVDLTAAGVAALAAGESRREVPAGKVSGLFLIVQPSGAKSWALRYRRDGRTFKFTIGPFPVVSIAEARSRAREAWAVIERGEHPGTQKRVVRQAARAARKPDMADTVEGVVALFIDRHAMQNTRPKTAAETKRILEREIVAPWRGRRLADITRKDVHHVLDGIIDRGAPVQANRSLAALSKLCAWAVERDIILTSPCEKIRLPAKEVSRNRVLSDSELRLAWAAFEADGWPFGRLFQVMTLTGQREQQCAAMRWAEIDLQAKVWTLQSNRTKNEMTHEVPLSPAVVDILEALPRIGPADFVFTTTGTTPISGFSNAKARVDARAGNMDVPGGANHWRLHDLRRTMATGLARLGFPPHVADGAIGHAGSIRGVVLTYNRHDYLAERRAAMAAWAHHVLDVTRNI